MILVIGGTGTIGSEVVRALAQHPIDVTVLSTNTTRAPLTPNVRAMEGDVRDIDFMRDLFAQTRTLFVLHPVVPDELTRALETLSLAADAGIERVVYFSMHDSDTWTDVPHASAKFAAERMIADLGIPATVLRPCYFMQNDANQRVALLQHGMYAMPIGQIGVDMVDARDVGELAALELVKREQAAQPLPAETIEIVGPDTLTGESIARLWSVVLARPIHYAGDIASFEAAARSYLSVEMAYDIALMLRHFESSGFRGTPGAADRLAARLGHPLRTYRAFAEELRDDWLGPRERAADLHVAAHP